MESDVKKGVSDAKSQKSGLDIQSMIQKLEECEFKVVADLFSLVNNDAEKETELVDLFARYYEKVGKSQEFLSWSVKWEVDRSDHANTLFRLESVATNLLFRHFFSDDGMYCLEMSVCPLIERVSKDVAANKEDLSKDVKYILKTTEHFLKELGSSAALFPVEIRESLRVLKKSVNAKFGNKDNVVGVVLFLRFLCPTILQPASFGITAEPLSMEVIKVLLPIAKLLQCIANEMYENKILDTSNEKIINFISDNVAPLKDFTKRLTNKQEINAIKKIIKLPVFRDEDKNTALQNIAEYIGGPEFPMPSLEVSKNARQLPTLVKKRKLISSEEKETHLGDILDTVKINLVFIVSEIDKGMNSYITIINESAKIKGELDKLGVKQIAIATGSIKDSAHWYNCSKFKGEVLVDTSGKMPQLFSMQKRKSTKANLFSAKMMKIRSKSHNFTSGEPFKVKPSKDKKNEDWHFKLFVLYGDRISFESKFRGEPQDLLNLLQACGASPETIATSKKRLKKKKRLSAFFSLRRSSVKSFNLKNNNG